MVLEMRIFQINLWRILCEDKKVLSPGEKQNFRAKRQNEKVSFSAAVPLCSELDYWTVDYFTSSNNIFFWFWLKQGFGQ